MSQAIAIGAGVCAGLTGMGLVIGGITTLALIPVFISSGSNNDNNNNDNNNIPSLSSIIGNNRTLSSHTAAVIAITVMNNLLASGSRNGEIIIWNSTNWQPKFKDKIIVNGEINGLTFVGSFSLASISSDGLNYWDIENAQNKLTFKNNIYGIMNNLLWNNQRSELMVSTSRGSILLFNLFGEFIKSFKASNTINALHQLLNGDILVQSSDSIRFFKNTDYSFLKTKSLSEGIDALKVTQPTKGINDSLMVYSYQSNVGLLNLKTLESSKNIFTSKNVFFISQLYNGLLVTASLNSLYFYNLFSGSMVNSVENFPLEITSIAVNQSDVFLGTNTNLIIVLENKNIENNITQPEPEEPKLNQIYINSHSQAITSLDIDTNGLIVSGSLDNSIAFINKSTVQILNKVQLADSIVYVKFIDSKVLVVTSKGNLSYIDSNTYRIDNSINISETVTRAQLIDTNILVGTETGFIRVYRKTDFVKIKEFREFGQSIDVIANLDKNMFAISSQKKCIIWDTKFSELNKRSITIDAETIAIFLVSSRKLVTVDRNGFIVFWQDQTYERLLDFNSKLSGSEIKVNSVYAKSQSILVGNNDKLVEYDLLTKIDTVTEIGDELTEIIIDSNQRPIIGLKNGSIVVYLTEILVPVTKSTKKTIVTSTVATKILTTVNNNSLTKNSSNETILQTESTTININNTISTQKVNQTETKSNQTTPNVQTITRTVNQNNQTTKNNTEAIQNTVELLTTRARTNFTNITSITSNFTRSEIINVTDTTIPIKNATNAISTAFTNSVTNITNSMTNITNPVTNITNSVTNITSV